MLYKFQSFNDNNISALEKNSAWFSNPQAFNDPFEGIYIDDTKEMSDSEFISLFKENKENSTLRNMFGITTGMDEWLSQIYFDGKAERLKKILKERGVNSLIMQQNYFYKTGVCCFIMGDNRKPINSSLMWGHYGDGLKGYVLEISSLPEHVFEGKVISIPVEYKKNPPRINSSELIKAVITKDKIEELESGDIEPLIKIMNTKHKRWRYENELRFISSQYGNKLAKYNEGVISSLYIGERMPSWQKAALIHIAKKNNIENIYEAYVNKESYSVSVKPLIML